MKTIVTVFAGRRSCMTILNRYLEKALMGGLIDEVHWWNYARTPEDERFLRENSNLRRTSSALHAHYTPVHPAIHDGAFSFSFRCSHNMHVRVTSGQVSYEIVLGGWDNTRSVIRRVEDGCDHDETASVDRVGLAHPRTLTYVTVKATGSRLQVFSGSSPSPSDLLMACDIEPGFTVDDVAMKTGFQVAGEVYFTSVNHSGVYLMDTADKSNWREYYQYYDDVRFQDTVILKCDDDVVFMDLDRLGNSFSTRARRPIRWCFPTSSTTGWPRGTNSTVSTSSRCL